MRTMRLWRGVRFVSALIGVAVLLTAALPAYAAPFDGRRTQFADVGFQSVWTRTDSQDVRGGRTWYWGPQPWFDYAEFYHQGVNGLRTVQYFDKARMEINHPDDRSFQGGVTNGLLVVELVSGHLKLGDDPGDVDYRTSADVPVAGNPRADNPTSPTYATFAALATFDNNAFKDPNRLGQRVGATLDKAGNLAFRQDFADAHPETAIAQYNTSTGHNIPQVFWNFMNLQGTVVENGRTGTRPIVDWLFAMGLPITDAYWIRAKVGAVEKDVMVQLFERRVLTYVPDNPAGYQVEMGNVGQHYFQWRYPNLGEPWASPDPAMPLLYASNARDGEHFEVYEYLATGSVQLTGSPLHPSTGWTNSGPFSYRRSYDPLKNCMLIDSPRGDGEHRALYQQTVVPAGFSGGFTETCLPDQLAFTDIPFGHRGPSDPAPANNFNPSVSPDGTKIVFASDRYGAPQLFIGPLNGSMVQPMTGGTDGCLNEYASWTPNGRTLYWERKCGDGKYTLIKGDILYSGDTGYATYATLYNTSELTTQDADNRYPRVSPDGSKIVFTSYRDGNAEIYVMDAGGENQARLTNNPAADEAATWSSDGKQLAFASNRDGDYDIYTMNADGTNHANLTNNTADDRWPAWAQ